MRLWRRKAHLISYEQARDELCVSMAEDYGIEVDRMRQIIDAWMGQPMIDEPFSEWLFREMSDAAKEAE